MKIKHLALRTFERPAMEGSRYIVNGSHLVVTIATSDGDILAEHFSDQPEGEFHEIPIRLIPSPREPAKRKPRKARSFQKL